MTRPDYSDGPPQEYTVRVVGKVVVWRIAIRDILGGINKVYRK